MKPEIKKRWVRALRSGKYIQGRNNLRPSEDRFCCLGVLCDIARKEGVGDWGFGSSAIEFVPKSGRRYSTIGAPPTAVLKWAGLTGMNSVYIRKHRATLAVLNDGKKKSFKEIADIIEKNL